MLTSNRGLCGGYNSGVLRHVMQRLRRDREADETISLEVSGKRGINFLKFQGRPADRTYTQFEDKPTFAQVEELADRFIEGFCSQEIRRLEMAYTKFESASRQAAVLERLLPIGTLEVEPAKGRNRRRTRTKSGSSNTNSFPRRKKFCKKSCRPPSRPGSSSVFWTRPSASRFSAASR